MPAKPCTIDRLATLADAHRTMREHAIRYLPVVDHGEPCGIVSERDLALIEDCGADPRTATVSTAMIEYPFIVASDTTIDHIVEIMGARHCGSVVVVGRAGVEGVFTVADACQAFATFVRDTTAN
jgi:CBS domain-containing protein